jgi:preprotein translocase subunit YajC
MAGAIPRRDLRPDHMIPVLFAQAQGASPSGGIGMRALLFQVLAFIAIFYFIILRPQQKERKRQEASLLALKKGDEVVTSGGIIAEVLHVQLQPAGDGKEARPQMGDRITIRSAESRLIVERGRIARVLPRNA